jgi:hypothetical protein
MQRIRRHFSSVPNWFTNVESGVDFKKQSQPWINQQKNNATHIASREKEKRKDLKSTEHANDKPL